MNADKGFCISIGLYPMRELSRRARIAGRRIDDDFADDIIIMGLEVYDQLTANRLENAPKPNDPEKMGKN